LEHETYECSACKVEVSRDATMCPNCGISFANSEEINPSEESDAENDKDQETEDFEYKESEFICPKCSADVTRYDTHCPLCGIKFKSLE